MTDYSRDVLFVLHDVARLMRVEADRRARVHGMTRAQWGILLHLDRRPGLSQKELAEILDVEPITVARLVDRLEARDLVERRPDPCDRRIWRLHLRPQAGTLMAEIHAQRQDIFRLVTEGMDPALQAALVDALMHMKCRLVAERRGEAAVEPPAPPSARAAGQRGTRVDAREPAHAETEELA